MSKESLAQVTRALKARMARSALLGMQNIDVRIGTALEVAGLFQRTSDETLDDYLAEIILDGNHPARVTTADGPNLFYRRKDDERHQFALDVKALLFSPNVRIRKAALGHFINLVNLRPTRLTGGTAKVLNEQQASCISSDTRTWQLAAIKIYDAIEADLLCQLCGLEQSIKERFDDGLRTYLPKLLKPSTNALEGLALRFARPSEHAAEIKLCVQTLLKTSSTLTEACDAYLEELGALPLYGDASFAGLVESWIEAHGAGNIDETLLAWVKEGSHLKLFYVTAYFLTYPQRLGAGSGDALIEAIVDILRGAGENEAPPATPTQWFWRVFEGLGEHYVQQLSTTAPGGHGEAIATSAWWLARRMSDLLCRNVTVIGHLYKVALEPAMRNSQLVWRFSNPRIAEPKATVASYWSLWQIALIGSINVVSSEMLAQARANPEDLTMALMRRLTLWSPISHSNNERPTFLFEVTLADALPHWVKVLNDASGREYLLELQRRYEELQDPDRFLAKLDTLIEADEADQLTTANAARLLSLQNALPLDGVWDKLNDREWRAKLFGKLTPGALELFAHALAHALDRGGDKWYAAVPHIYAQACDDNSSDKARLELLFMCVVLSCIHCYSVSALERSLRGPLRPDLLPLAQEWKDRLRVLARESSPWVAARLRALNAAIAAST